MANALNVKIGGDLRELEKALDSAAGKIRSAGKRMTSVGKTLTASVTAPLTALGITSLKTAADFETLQQSMNILNGSVKEGARNFERLKQFSAGTPFQLQDLASAQNMLQGFGQTADDAFDSLSMIGDIAAVTGGSIEGIGIAFGQASAEGMLMTRDIRQLVNQGVPALKLLAETMGVGKDEIFDLASQGKISFEILQQAFRDATSEGGMFANGMEQQSQTLNGLFSTLKDNISIAMAEIGESIADALNLREVVPQMIERIKQVTQWFKHLSTEARTSIVNIVRAIMTIGPALLAVGTIVTALGVTIGLLTSPITLVVGAIAGLVTAIIYLRDNWQAVIERVSDIGWWRNAIINMIQFFNDQFLFRIFDGFNALLQLFGGSGFANPFSAVSAGLESLKVETKEFENEFGSLKDAFINTFTEFTGINLHDMFTPVAQGAERAKASINSVGRTAREISTDFITLETVAVPALKRIGSETSNAITFAKQIADDFTNSFGAGMANVFVESKKVLDTVKNIGKLLASSIIQKGISALLTGGLGGTGFFGAAGGLFGKIFGVNDALITSAGDVVQFNSADDILASRNMDQVIGGGSQRVEVFGTLKGQDLFVSSDRGSRTYGR